ncbi:MAG: hypothetical protein R3Y50_07950 [Rikenellaceae bacterium]
MASKSTLKEAVERWKQLTETIQTMSIVDTTETVADQILRIERARKDYAYFVEYYFPHYCTNEETGEIIPSAKFHIEAAKKILKNRNIRAVFKWARGHAKSTHVDVMIPMWLMMQKRREINVMVLVSKSEDAAKILLGDIQAELQYNKRYIHDFGVQYNAGNWQDGEFATKEGVAFFARGRGQSPRGLRYRDKRPNYIVIDDLDDDELCENEKRVNKLVEWVKEALFGAFSADGGRFIMVGNLIGKCSVLAKVSASKGVFVSQVNIVDKYGKPSWSAYWKPERIKEMRDFMGYRAFEKEYMNNPIKEGTVFRKDWIKFAKMRPLQQYDRIIAYCDPSFKGSTSNDYKAIKVWGKVGTELHHLFAFVRQCSVSEMVRWFYDLHEKLPDGVLCGYYIEANFLQDIILDEFTVEGELRGYQLPIVGDKRKKPDKFQRIEAISPLWERGFVYYNEDMQNDPDMLTGIEQTLSIEKGSRTHDDAPDADEGAIYLLQKYARVESFKPTFGKRPKPKNTW